MRRILSILLLCLFGLSMASPLLALGHTPQGRLPACCRKGGDHHCTGGMSAQTEVADAQASPNPRLGSLTTPCPYAPGAVVSCHANLIAAPTNLSGLLAPLPQHVVVARNAAMRQIIEDRSRPKRGPPSSTPA